MLELCELSLKGIGLQKDAAVLSAHISMLSIDNVGFAHPILVGDIISLKAKVIYVEPKKGLVYVQVFIRAIDQVTGKFTTHDS